MFTQTRSLCLQFNHRCHFIHFRFFKSFLTSASVLQDLSSSFAGMTIDPPPAAPTHHHQQAAPPAAEPARPARKADPPARPPPPNVASGEGGSSSSSAPPPNPYAGAPGPLPYPVQAAMPMPFAPYTPMPGRVGPVVSFFVSLDPCARMNESCH